MDASQIQINAEIVVNRLSSRVGELEREVAVLLAQQEALIAMIEGASSEDGRERA